MGKFMRLILWGASTVTEESIQPTGPFITLKYGDKSIRTTLLVVIPWLGGMLYEGIEYFESGVGLIEVVQIHDDLFEIDDHGFAASLSGDVDEFMELRDLYRSVPR